MPIRLSIMKKAGTLFAEIICWYGKHACFSEREQTLFKTISLVLVMMSLLAHRWPVSSLCEWRTYVRVITGWKSDQSYDENRYLVGLYKIMVAMWIVLGLASCASFLTTVQETCTTILRRVKHKAVELKERVRIGGDKEDKDCSSVEDSKHSPLVDAVVE